jgi:hypothetical protein
MKSSEMLIVKHDYSGKIVPLTHSRIAPTARRSCYPEYLTVQDVLRDGWEPYSFELSDKNVAISAFKREWKDE